MPYNDDPFPNEISYFLMYANMTPLVICFDKLLNLWEMCITLSFRDCNEQTCSLQLSDSVSLWAYWVWQTIQRSSARKELKMFIGSNIPVEMIYWTRPKPAFQLMMTTKLMRTENSVRL